MVRILDGNSGVGAHVRSNICHLICLRDLIKSRAVTNRIFFSPNRPIFLHGCATCSKLSSNISSMIRNDGFKRTIIFEVGIGVYLNAIRPQKNHTKLVYKDCTDDH